MESSKLRPQVVVVGAGISGLSAACALHKSGGVDVTVLEGGSRVGGRIHSTVFAGERVELGANWIHGTHGSPVMKIAMENGLLEVEEGPWGGTRWTGGISVRSEGGTDVDPAIVREVKALYKKLIYEANEIGMRAEMGGNGGRDAAGRQVGLTESLGAFLRGGLVEHLRRRSESAVEAAQIQVGSGDQAQGAGGGVVDWNDDEAALRASIFATRERLECTASGCDSLDDVSLRYIGEYEELPGPHIPVKGYSRVCEIMAERLSPGAVLLDKEVVSVHWLQGGRADAPSLGPPVKIVCKDGSSYNADHVIVTVSLGVLKERAAGPAASDGGEKGESEGLPGGLFDPPLPGWKAEAIRRMGFCVVGKVFVEFPRPGIWGGNKEQGLEIVWSPESFSDWSERPPYDWPAAILSELPPLPKSPKGLPGWTQKLHDLHPLHLRSNVVISWLAGRETVEMERASDDDVAAAVVATIERFVPPGTEVPAPLAVLRTSWGTNPLFRGSYSFVKVGQRGTDIATLAEPLPRVAPPEEEQTTPRQQQYEPPTPPPLQVLFAGEATDRHHYSNTHGAYFSGRREAARILALYGMEIDDEDVGTSGPPWKPNC